MKVSSIRSGLLFASVAALALAGCSTKAGDNQSSGAASSGAKTYTTEEVTDGTTTFTRVTNPNGGKTLSYGKDSGFTLLEEKQDGFTYAFKDMNGNGKLDKWEDWRLNGNERAADLVGQLSIEQVEGLMLFSSHEGAASDGLTEPQKTYLSKDRLRNVLNASDNNIEANVSWVNAMEAYVETLATEGEPYIPVNFSSDPRSDAAGGYTEKIGDADISVWPNSLGLAATFSVDTVAQFAQMASEEYRALGINMALSPQIDLATDPRWSRNNGTFGENTEMTAAMAKAYVEGFQSTFDAEGNNLGWGDTSVATTIKHFPGDGSGEGGRESHSDIGKYAVYPDGNEAGTYEPFLSVLDSGAVMLSYSVGVAADGTAAFGDLLATAYDQKKVDILRKDNGYDGVIMTDWRVTHDVAEFGGPWGMETATVNERHYKILQSGVDMFGGNNELAPVQAAYTTWQKDFEAGKNDVDAETRFRESGERVVRMIFNSGVYENPFQNLATSTEEVGSADKVEAGYEAQLNSVVMVKNQDKAVSCEATAPDYSKQTVYIPQTYDLGFDNPMLGTDYSQGASLNEELAAKYFGTVVTDKVELDKDGKVVSYTAPDLKDVDVVMVGMQAPQQGGLFSGFNTATGKYVPISLQYRPYTADGDNVRKTSIAGNILEDGSKENRSYLGQTSQVSNEADLDAVLRAADAVKKSGKDIPIIAIIHTGDVMMDASTVIPAEFEPYVDSILIGYGISQNAYFDVALGLHEPAGRLPLVMPASMDAVEASFEDVPEDVTAYKDAAGNSYEFGFGLNCSGVISD